MALNLYRRHRRDFKSRHPEEFRSSEFDERKKGWKRCECAMFASGTPRQLPQAGKATQRPHPQAQPSERINIDRAVKAFTAEFEGHARTG